MSRVWEHLCVGAAIVVCAFAPLAIGGVHLWAVGTATALALVFFAASAYRRVWCERLPFQVGWVGGVFCVVTLWTAIQLIPLPASWIEVLSAKAHELFRFALAPLGEYGPDASRPLALDPPSTAGELVRLVGLSAAYLAARNGFVSRKEVRRVYTGLVAVGALLVLIGIVQKVAHSQHILGVYYSGHAAARFFTSTFVNPNHLAGFLLLTTALSFGLAFREKDSRPRRIGFAAAGALGVIGVLFSLSRAGIAALVASQALLVALIWWRGRNRRGRLFWLGASLLVALGLAAWFAMGRIATELSLSEIVRDLEGSVKVQMWSDTLSILGDFGITGIGKGSFFAAYPLYQSSLAPYTFTHPENAALQALVDHGVIVGGILIATVATAVLVRLVREGPTLSAAAAAGVAGLLLHNLADYNLEVAGVAFPFAVVLGALLRPGGEWTRIATAMRRRLDTGLVALGLAAGIAACAWALPYARGHNKDRAVDAIRAAPESVEAIVAATAGALEDHPLDYLLHLTAAARLSTGRAVDLARALRFANRALYLNDASSEAHRVAARILRRRGNHDQAIIEYRLSLRGHPGDLPRVVDEILSMPRPVRSLLRLSPGTRRRRRVARHLIVRGQYSYAKRVAEALRRENPRDPAARYVAAWVALVHRDYAGAVAHADMLRQMEGQTLDAVMLAAEAYRRAGHLDAAISAYRTARAIAPRRTDLYIATARAQLALQRGAAALRTLESLRRIDVAASSANHVAMLLGRAWELEGKRDRARDEYRRVLSRNPKHAEAAARLRALGQ